MRRTARSESSGAIRLIGAAPSYNGRMLLTRYFVIRETREAIAAGYPCAATSYVASEGGAEKKGTTLATCSR